MPDGDVAAQRGERGLVEDLGHEAEILEHDHAGAVGDGYAGSFLAAVLQRIETEVCEFRYLFARRPHPEDATRVLRAGATLRVDLMAEPAVASWHCHSFEVCEIAVGVRDRCRAAV